MKFLELFCSCVLMWSVNYNIGKKLLNHKKKNKLIKTVTLIILFSIFLSIINEIYFNVLNGVIKLLLSYFLICIFFKIVFKKKNEEILVTGLIIDLIMFISEIILAIIISIIIKFFNYDSLAFLKHSLFINLLNSILSYCIAIIFKEKFSNLIRNTKINEKSNIFIIILLLITIAMLFFRIPLNKWNFNAEFIVTMIILICSCAMGLFVLKQKSIIQKTNLMYHQLAQYSDITNNVLEEYRVANHEYKNQLLIIRSMINKKNKELIDYTDNLLEKVENIKYKWIGQLNHLPLSGLKGLINYKVLEMETLKLNKSISISNGVSKIKLNKLTLKQKDNLYSIIGVYLDNAIYASKESKQKEISLEVYKEKTDLVIIVANTYKGKINLEKINDYGYTTKGKNHGVGLHLVNQIINSDSIFQAKNYLLDNYFVQELRVDSKSINAK